MSAKKYVPNRLRGVLGGDDASPSSRLSSSARAKGKKARPWRVDAASWKQQLQERKAVYDNFALQEKAEEEKEASSQVPKKEEEFESIPLNVLTSTTAGGGGKVEAMLTPNRGGQVETVFTSSTPKTLSPSSASASPSFSTGNSQTADKSNDDYDTITRQDSYLSNSSKSTSSKPRRPSPLPRNRKTTRKGKRSPSGNTETSPHRTKRVTDFNDNNSTSDDGDSETEDWMNESSNSTEYYIDVSGGVAGVEKEMNKKKAFEPKTRVRLLRHGHSDDTAESIGLPAGEAESSSDMPVNKSSMMAAVEDFIDPSRANSKPIFARRGAGAEVVVREIPNRRGGRRRQSPKTLESQATQPQLSPPTSTTSTAGTIMGDSSYQDSIFRATQDNVGLNSTSGVDDEWSIRPIPSEEEICLEKRRWPLREDADTATMSSGDTEMISVAPNDVVIIPSTSQNKKSQREEQTPLSSSPSKKSDNRIAASSSKEKVMKTPERENHGSGEVPSTTGKGVTPDPLQKARKTLLLSNLNRSVRSLLDSSSHSRQDTDTIGDSSIESSFSTSIFVPLRSRQEPPTSQNDGAKEIPLNVLDDHGVYVSKYNKNGIYVPPNNSQEECTTGSSTKETADDMYNELGAYVPRDRNGEFNDDNVVEQKGQPDGNGSIHESVSTRSLESAQTDKMEESSKMIANIDSGHDVDKDHDEDTSGVDVVENNEGSIEQKVNAVEYSEAKALSQDQLQAETESSKGNSDGANLQEEGTSFGENTEKDNENEFDVVASCDDSKLTADQKTTSSENQIEDATDINDDVNIDYDYVVDEIDANRIRLISALKRRVTSIYIGNHICIESVGTSEDEDPLATARQKRAARKAAYNAHLKVQLNDTVTALNTDHHHVVESPGKVKSVKGKKWKERMAMKKLSKKNGADTKNEEKTNPPFQEPTDDDALEEQSDAVALVQKSEMNEPDVEKSEGESEEAIKDQSPVDDLKEIDDIVESSIERETTETTEIANENAFFGQTEDNMIEPRGSDDEIDRSSHEIADEPENTSAASMVEKIDSIPDATNCAHENSEEAKSVNIVSTTKEKEEVGLSNQDDNPIASDITHEPSGKATNSVDFISISKEEEIDHVTPDTGHDTSDSAHDTSEEQMRESRPSNSSEPEDIRPTTEEKIPENIKDTLALSEEPEGPGVQSTPEKVPEVNHDVATFVISQERQEDTDLPIATDDNNIIQGLPPNKGKKWKDRLRKKKNKKSEKNGATAQDNSEAGEGANEIIITETVDHTQATILVSPSNSYDEDATNMISKARPSFNRNLSDLTAEEKQRAVSPMNVAQTEPPPTNVGKKSNKWKNRLAKIKGSKQENTKPVQTDMKVDDSVGTTDRGQILVDFKSPNTTAVVKPNLPSGDSDRGQILIDFKSPTMSPVVKHELPPGSADRGQILVDFRRPDASPSGALEPVNKQPLLGALDTPKQLEKNETEVPTATSSNPKFSNIMAEDLSNIQSVNQNESKKQDSQMHQNLKQSFDVFDAFLQNGLENATDEQSLYTEMTIGQETYLQSGLPVAHGSEEELSYMDFTIEDTVQPSFAGQNTASKVAPKAVAMSPFMSNLLSSRMFQDDAPIIPKMSLPKAEEPEKQSKTADSPENLKKFPTITVGDAFDDDMTQITMGSLEDHNEKENGDEEFFDAESKPLQRSPSSKSIGKQSNSGKSESGSSNPSQLPCSETSKQRIVEILRKEVWSRDKDVVKSAIEELDTEARNGHHHRAHIVRCGGVMTIMRAMEMNSDSAAIQIASCSTLETLALDPQTQIAICEMEGISLIVRSMQVHFENVKLQESSCCALATICRHHETSISKDLMKDAEEAVPTILSCMTRYPTNTCIQGKGFQAVANLCSGSHAHQRLEELSKAGGIMTLTMALQTPWENKNDQHEAISNLSILLRGVTEIKEKSSSVPVAEIKEKSSSVPVAEIKEKSSSVPVAEIKEKSSSMPVTEIKEKPSSIPTSLNAIKKDGSSEHRNEAESAAYEEGDNGEVPSDNETVTSYMSEIPDMPMMSDMSINCEEIPDLDQYPPDLDQYPPDLDQYSPDLDQYPAMMSNVEWQNFGEDDLDAGRKTSVDPTSPAKAGAQQEGVDKEQCVIQ